MEERNYYIYKHTSPSGKVYIGMTKQNPKIRWRKDGSGYKNNRYFDRAIQKYGWDNFQHEILYEGLTKEDASMKEKELIKQYKSNNSEYGYNISSGGEGGREGVPQSEEAKRKVSIANKGRLAGEKNHLYGVRKYQKENPFYGKHHTEETKEKLSNLHKGKKMSDDFKSKISKAMSGKNNPRARKVLQYDLDMKLVKIWDYLKLAANTLNITEKDIRNCCNGNRESYKGYIWKYEEKDS
jgi:group I intron endonuclease